MTHVYSDRDDGSIKISTISVRAFTAPVVLAFASSFFFASVNAAVIDFEGYQPGRIIDDEYAPDVLINGLNFRYGAGPSRSIVFDSDNPTGGDIDLSAPFDSNDSGLQDNYKPGHILILQTLDDCNFGTGFCAVPDDEGRRPAGEFEFTFSEDVVLETIDFFDIEFGENNRNPNSEIHLYDALNVEIQPDTWFVPDTGGDNMWGQLNFGAIEGVRRFVIEMAGSGAIDNVTYTPMSPVPLPASAWPFGSAIGFLGWLRRRGMVRSPHV
jgi:hypothetical protein